MRNQYSKISSGVWERAIHGMTKLFAERRRFRGGEGAAVTGGAVFFVFQILSMVPIQKFRQDMDAPRLCKGQVGIEIGVSHDRMLPKSILAEAEFHPSAGILKKPETAIMVANTRVPKTAPNKIYGRTK